ncbi:hypothetical protein EDB85DRAFT_1896492 [Lactarius pseudohatsudake]|nr:hypothetical protein EDB85DRAFT_1896492 [Lactarius pseudohatsudake]
MRCGRGERGRTETVQPRCATWREAGSTWPRAPLPARTGHHKSGRLALARSAKREGKGVGATRRAGRCRKGKRAGATRRGGAVCPRAPPFHANEEGEAGGVTCPRVSPVRVFLPSHALTPHEWGGVDKRDGAGAGPTWRGGAGCADKREGPGPTRFYNPRGGLVDGATTTLSSNKQGSETIDGMICDHDTRGGGAECSCTPPFRAKGREGPGGRMLPFRAYRRGQVGRGGAGGKPSCAPFSREWGAVDRGSGSSGGMPSCALLPRKRGGADGEKGGPGRDFGLRPLFARMRGLGGEEREERRRGWAYYHTQFRTNVRIVGESRGGEGKAGGRVVLDPVAEVKRACHVSTSADVAAFHWRATLPFPPSYRVPPNSYRIGTQEDRPYIPYITRRPVHAQTRVHQERGSARGHAAPSLSPSPRHPVRAERERTRVHPSPTSLRPSPSPPTLPLSAPPIRTEGGTPPPSFPIPAEGVTPPPLPLPPVPPFPPRPRKGAHKGTLPPAPPFPVCAEEVRTRGTPPPLPVATGPSLDRAPLYARARHPRPNPFAFAQKRGAPHATPSPSPLTSPPRTRGKGAREVTQPPAPSFPVALGPSPSPLTSPPRSRGKWAREGTPLRSYPSAFAWKGGGPHAAPSPRRPWPLPLPFGRAALSTRARHLRPHLSP